MELASSPIPVPKGKSAAAFKLEKERREVFEGDLRRAYSNAFGDEKKAPKPKFLEATALVKIRKEKGESAYQAKIKEYVNRNRGSFEGKTKKKVTFSNKPHTAAPDGNTMKSITEMAKAAKDSIDAMVDAMRGHTTKHRKTRSNKGTTRRKSAVPLPNTANS
jgi:predicted solute-binding protein